MNQENEENVSYYMPPKSVFKRVVLQLKRILGLMVEPVARTARWKRHEVYKFKPRRYYNVKMKRSSGHTWRRHKIPPMPRPRSVYM
jgi:hypothetical protein